MSAAITDPSQPTRDIALLLALCPAVAVSDTLVNAIGLGLAILIVALITVAITRAIERWLSTETRVPAVLLSMAGATAGVEMLMNAWLPDLRESLSIFLPVLAVNAGILLHAAAGESHPSAGAGVKATVGVATLMIVLGAARELVGRGSILHDAASLFGPGAAGAEINLFRVDMGFLLAMLPPGAFIALGLAIAVLNWIALRRHHRAT